MTRKRRFLLIVALVVIVVAAAGVTVARAVGGPDLPAMTPAQLLAKVAEQAPKTTALSGDYAFTNNILGADAGPLASFAGLGVPFLSPEGSGKVAMADGKANLTLVGGASSMQFVLNGTTLWVYTSTTNTATEYTLPAHPAGADSGDASADTTLTTPTMPSDPAAAIAQFLEKMAPEATVAVTGQQEIAGRAAYTLTLTPTATNTVFGSAKVAIDGQTFVPLRAEISAKGTDAPVLSVGFTSISYAAPAASAFDFTTPAGATVQKQDLSAKFADAAAGLASKGHDEAAAAGSAATDKPAELTLGEAQTKTGFHVLAPTTVDPVLPFGGASVMVIPADLAGKMAAASAADAPTGAPAAAAPDASGLPSSLQGLGQGLGGFAQGFIGELKGPAVVQHYGKGFGSVMLAQVALNGTGTTDSLFGGSGAGAAALSMLPLFGSTTVNGHQAVQMATPLGGFLVWEQDGMLLLAGGMVSKADLAGFASSLQ